MESIKKVERYLQTRKKSDSKKFFLKFRFRNVEKVYELGCETVEELNRAMRHIEGIMPMWRAELWIDGKKEI